MPNRCLYRYAVVDQNQIGISEASAGSGWVLTLDDLLTSYTHGDIGPWNGWIDMFNFYGNFELFQEPGLLDKSILINKDFLTWLLIGSQPIMIGSQPIRSHVWKFMLDNMDFDMEIS